MKCKGRLPKGVAIQELEALIANGETMLGSPINDMAALFERSVEHLEWTLQVKQFLPQMSRALQVLADFQRLGSTRPLGAPVATLDYATNLQRTLHAQIDVLRKALERWAKSGTRPLQ